MASILQVCAVTMALLTLVNATCGIFDNSVYDENLRIWTIEGGSDASWTFSGSPPVDNTGIQSVNTALPTYLVTPRGSINSLKGSIRVTDTSDDDFIGLVFASGTNAIIMSWKRRDQGHCSGTAPLGTGLLYTTSYGTTNTALGCDYWLGNTGTVRTLARGNNFGSTGWVANTYYRFTALFTTSHITIYINDVIEFDYDISSFLSIGSSFPMDKIGFYGLSQPDVEYSNVQVFSVNSIVSCEPATYRSYFDPQGCSVNSFRAEVDYNDGTGIETVRPTEPSSGLPYFDLSHGFPAAGTYTITLSLIRSGSTVSTDRVIALSSAALTASVSLVPQSTAQCGFTLQCGGSATLLVNSVTGGEGAPYTASWSDEGTDFNPLSVTSRTITSPGEYYLEVSDSSCSFTSSTLTATQSSFSAITASLNAQCGSITASATGTASCQAFSYIWGDTSSTTSATRTGLGIGTYTVTAQDVNQCTSSPASVTIVDQPPTARCQTTITKEVGNTGSVTVSTSDINNGSTDPCGLLSLAMDVTSFTSGTCASVGTRTSTMIASGYSQFSTTSCSTTVSVVDTVLPTALCRDFATDFTAPTYTLATSSIDNGSSDTCGVSLTATPNTFTLPGNYVVTLTARDPSGNIDTCTSNVFLRATEPLTATLTQTPDSAAQCGFSLTCAPGSSATLNLAVSGGYPPYTARWTDQSSNFDPESVTSRTVTSPGSFSFQVTDTFGTTISATPVAVTRSSFSSNTVSLNSQCGSITASAVGTANCQAFSYIWADTGSTTSATRTGLPIGTYSVTARDVNQCTSSPASVTIVDQPPTARCQSTITKEVGNTGSVTVSTSDIDNGSTDPCGLLSLAMDSGSFTSGTCASVGTRTSTMIASGYSQFSTTSCSTTVSVVDTVLPTARCRDFNTDFPTGGTYTLAASSIDDGSSDTCGVSLSASPNTFTLPGYYTVTLTALDPSGNSRACTSTVFLRATEPLSATLTQTPDSAAQCGFSLTCAPGSSASLNLAVSGGYPPYTARWTDQSSNFDPSSVTSRTVTSPGSYTFQVTDNLGNIITPVPAVVTQSSFSSNTLSLNSQCGSITASAVGTANCQPFTYLWADMGSGPATRTGLSIGTYTVTARDANQCTSSAASVNVVDQPPTAVCKNSITLDVGVSGSVSVSPADIDNGSSDPCGLLALSMSGGSFTGGNCGSVGSYTNTLIASGYSEFTTDSCTSTVNVVDNVKPVARCRDFAVNLPASGSYTLSISSIDNGSSDVCGVALSASQTVFNNFGEYFVTLTATDPSGNTDSCVSRVQLYGFRIVNPVQGDHLFMYVPFTIDVSAYLPNDSTMRVQVIETISGSVYKELPSRALAAPVDVTFYKTFPGAFQIVAVSEQTGVVALNSPTVSLCVTPYASCNYV